MDKIAETIETLMHVQCGDPINGNGLDKAIDNAIELLEPLMWIPVTERLPEKPKPDLRRGWYLVALESGCVMSLGFEYDGRKWFSTASPVTHWMPLPQPPKEGDGE